MEDRFDAAPKSVRSREDDREMRSSEMRVTSDNSVCRPIQQAFEDMSRFIGTYQTHGEDDSGYKQADALSKDLKPLEESVKTENDFSQVQASACTRPSPILSL